MTMEPTLNETNLAHYLSLVDELREAGHKGEPVGRIFGRLDAAWTDLSSTEMTARVALLK